ncbi:hypothetical protein OQA88_8054 [Cercophora sp. LCS_1]
MPAMLNDPEAPTIYRVSGEPPFPDPAHPSLPTDITPHHVTLRDRQTVATVIPYASRHTVPQSLLQYLSDQLNKEIEGGDTYPFTDTMTADKFATYWFQNFGGIMVLGHIERAEDIGDNKDWSKECLGAFYIKPNYPGRSSHVCNAGFIVTDASRNRGVGRLMGEMYLEWAPRLGYTYSVFNLVYETNVASCKIWDALGFKRIGRVKGAGALKSHPDRLVDAIIFGRDLGNAAGGAGNEELVSEERFDKIKFYLKYGHYPNGADRAEKSRLRSAAMHYKLLEGDILMLKDKEVISDPQRQYEIARKVHNQSHAGINKSTATIAEQYHWSRIKETVSDVIRNCHECKELGKASASSSSTTQIPITTNTNNTASTSTSTKRPHPDTLAGAPTSKRASPSPLILTDNPASTTKPNPSALPDPTTHPFPLTFPVVEDLPPTTQPLPPHMLHHHVALPPPVTVYQPIDPQIISQPPGPGDHHHHHSHNLPPLPPHSLHHHHYAFNQHHHHGHHHHDDDANTFQALLNAADDDVTRQEAEDQAEREAVDRDMEMLIEEPQDDEEQGGGRIDRGAGKMDVSHLLSGGDDDEVKGGGRGVYDVGGYEG